MRKFLEALKALGHTNWYALPSGAIRRRVDMNGTGRYYEDPISAVFESEGKRWYRNSFARCGTMSQELGLTDAETIQLIAAIDNRPDSDSALRSQLMEACKLSPEAL